MAMNRRQFLVSSLAITAASILPEKSDAWIHGAATTPASQFSIILNYETSALAAPQSFRDACQTVANMYQAAILDNITVKFLIGYGDIDNGLAVIPPGSAETIVLASTTQSYTTIKSALTSHLINSALQTTFLNSLPTGSTLAGLSNFNVPSTNAKCLGLWAAGPHDTSVNDAAIGIASSGIGASDLLEVIIHEFGHAMGRIQAEAPHDFSRYSGAGARITGTTNSSPQYFSPDGGVTDYGDYVTGAAADNGCSFVDTTVNPADGLFDAYDASYHPGGGNSSALSVLDKNLLECYGYKVAY